MYSRKLLITILACFPHIIFRFSIGFSVGICQLLWTLTIGYVELKVTQLIWSLLFFVIFSRVCWFLTLMQGLDQDLVPELRIGVTGWDCWGRAGWRGRLGWRRWGVQLQGELPQWGEAGRQTRPHREVMGTERLARIPGQVRVCHSRCHQGKRNGLWHRRR